MIQNYLPEVTHMYFLYIREGIEEQMYQNQQVLPGGTHGGYQWKPNSLQGVLNRRSDSIIVSEDDLHAKRQQQLQSIVIRKDVVLQRSIHVDQNHYFLSLRIIATNPDC